MTAISITVIETMLLITTLLVISPKKLIKNRTTVKISTAWNLNAPYLLSNAMYL